MNTLENTANLCVESCYEDFFRCFEVAVLDAVKPRMLLTLTGGMDSRIIAGILACNNVDMPAITYGSYLENMVASHVAGVLGFKHYCFPIAEQLSRYTWLKERNFEYLLRGSYFDEVNGAWLGYIAKSRMAFEFAVEKCLVSAKYETNGVLKGVSPILDPDVLDCLSQIPWQLRKGKLIQKWILKTKFSKLWGIIYYDSMLPLCFPFHVHSISDVAIHKAAYFVRRKMLDKS